MSLPILVAQDKWQDFDDAWNELMLAEGSIEELLTALRLAGDKKRIARCVPLVRQHVELLEEGGRHADAARLLGAAMLAGGAPAELGGSLLDHARKAWGEEPWWESTVQLTGLEDENTDVRRAWKAFNKVQEFRKGTIVFHPGGWGTGEILAVRPEDSEIDVRFANGRTDHFPISAAVDIFEPLPEGDLRARHYHDPDGFPKEVKKEPLQVLRAVAERYHGRATIAALKNALAQIGIEGSAWSAWWRKARKLAENDPWFRLTGSGNKMEIHLLLTAADPVADLERALRNLGALEPVLERARDLFGNEKTDPALREVAVEALEELAADQEAEEEAGLRLTAWLFVRQFRGETPAALAQLLEEARAAEPPEDPTEAPALWKLFHELPTARDQELAIELLEELYGETWLDQAALDLQHAAPGMVRPLVEKLMAAKRHEELAGHYNTLLARPLRSPHVLVALARLVEGGKLKGEFPPPTQRAQSLLTLATHLWQERRADAASGRVHTRLVEFLAGKEPVLERLLADADPRTLRSVQLLIQRGVEESIDNIVTSLVFHAGPVEGEVVAAGFWEDEDKIYTTRSGLERTSKELKHLYEVKMPENEAAIGRAAAMGDLSENAEWDAAMEEKRNLSDRAARMEAEIRRATLLENASLPDDTVCPGTTVRYRDTVRDEEHTITILGPWDTEGREDVVSYFAPLARGLLGMHPGERRHVQLPAGGLDIEVVSVEPAPID